MKNILLISPHAENEALWVSGDEGPCDDVKNNFVPLGLATVAALTPEGYQVDIWDEIVHGRIDQAGPLKRKYDLVGITGYINHIHRGRELAAYFRQRDVLVAAGGPGVSCSPDLYREHFDIVFCGEVEKTWPQFLHEWAQGTHKKEYHQIEKPDLSESPAPRWDSILDVIGSYAMGCVQTTRGCPFDCEFCDVIYLFGRRSRHKPIERVLEEVRTLEALGKDTIFFCDDEFIGDPKYAKDLLRALIPVNNSFQKPLTYSTQLTMNLSRDEELLELMADANFNLVFIGIESPNQESLQETGKLQNIRKDLVGDIHKILSYGIAIRAGIMVGFDHDDTSIFDIQYDFIQRACLQSLAINILKAPLGTKLWTRLRQEGRVISLAKVRKTLGNPKSYTNILPKSMSRIELMAGYRDLQSRLHSWPAFSERIKNFVSLVTRMPQVNEPPLSADEALAMCLPLVADDAEAATTIEDIIRHTERTAPYMMRRVKIIIVQYLSYLTTIHDLLPQIDRQIQQESSPSYALEFDSRPITIPPAFREGFQNVFYPVHARVYVNITNKDLLGEALTEIFVDFLVAWGKDFYGFEGHHRAFLQEICDRTCAKFEQVPPQLFVPKEVGDTKLPNVKRTRLAEDVLKNIEQEMIKLASAVQPREALQSPLVELTVRSTAM